MGNCTLYSLTKPNSAALGMEGEAWLDLRCFHHLSWWGRGRTRMEIQRDLWMPSSLFLLLPEKQIERTALWKRSRLWSWPLLHVYTFSFFSHLSLWLFAFLLFIIQIFDKPQRTWLKTYVYLAAAPGVVIFCLLKEGSFPPSLLAQLPTAALLPFIIDRGSSWGIFLVKRDPQGDRKRAQVWSGSQM